MTEDVIEAVARFLADRVYLSHDDYATYDNCSPYDRETWHLVAEEVLELAARLRREEVSPMTAREWLAKRAELEAAATEGPWSFTHGPNELPRIWSDAPECEDEFIAKCAMKEDVPDAAFIADARTSAPAMRKALEAVLDGVAREPATNYYLSEWERGYRAAMLDVGRLITAALEPTP